MTGREFQKTQNKAFTNWGMVGDGNKSKAMQSPTRISVWDLGLLLTDADRANGNTGTSTGRVE